MAAVTSLISMTGFARTEGIFETYAWVWELKSLNHRGLDIRLRSPSALDGLEHDVRKLVPEYVTRGAVNLSLDLKAVEGTPQIHLDEVALAQVISAAKKVRLMMECAPSSAEGLLALKGVLTSEDTQPDDAERKALAQAILTNLREALIALNMSRAAEGAKMQDVLTSQINEIETITANAQSLADSTPEAIRSRIEHQLKELLQEDIPEDRLTQEAAVLAVKADIREELDRLRAHVIAARALLAEKGAVGRKLDFLSQEFNREANTLCSKAQTIELKQLGLSLKAVIDQMREQVQNIE